ncbi:21s rrna (uridine-2-o)-methyltransferase mrm2 [Diplodia corticola]|uniref:rRNA methyltransferase 2, mitochondrial n=1 Tax=Diplodia corticola TaxID=236234 RepID=A0A1J9SB01_9PEZI|nr:21s rrna (uridine-2-o)-methyltransferase mrm2 [Diplodia corticola]OJD37044.1 21s rrna (uridine-2-o)-methyltransferase mrm2 [Diplodia corticola]
MLSLRLIRQLADSALVGRPFAAPHRLPPCRACQTTAAARRTITIATASSRPDASRAASAPSDPPYTPRQCVRSASSSSSTVWKSRQGRDYFAREAKVRGLKSRAAFKLLEMNQRYRLFRAGNTVVDLGYAPGSWSQVAIDRTQPGGRVIGIDVIPAQPPRGVSTIQGDFLSEAVQAEVRAYVQDPERGRPLRKQVIWAGEEGEHGEGEEEEDGAVEEAEKGYTEADLEEQERGYIDREKMAPLIARPDAEDGGSSHDGTEHTAGTAAAATTEGTSVVRKTLGRRAQDEAMGRVVDVVLSDMSAPWAQTSGFHKRSITEPYLRMMNTSGTPFRDHAGSMDLCHAALGFAYDTLRTGGNFVCKFYQGAEDKALERKLRRMFEKVFREKPDSSRTESKEFFFIGIRRKPDPPKEEVFKNA